MMNLKKYIDGREYLWYIVLARGEASFFSARSYIFGYDLQLTVHRENFIYILEEYQYHAYKSNTCLHRVQEP